MLILWSAITLFSIKFEPIKFEYNINNELFKRSNQVKDTSFEIHIFLRFLLHISRAFRNKNKLYLLFFWVVRSNWKTVQRKFAKMLRFNTERLCTAQVFPHNQLLYSFSLSGWLCMLLHISLGTFVKIFYFNNPFFFHTILQNYQQKTNRSRSVL